MFKGRGLFKIVVAIFLALFSTTMALAEKKSKGRLDTFEKTLQQMGFNVQEGLVDFPDIVDMCCECQIFSCFANNPSSPYGVFVLPPAPGQEATNPYAEWFEVNEDNDPNNPWYDENQKDYPEGGSWFWRLRPDEAVVFLGTTPPEMTYFGFTGYLYDRYRYSEEVQKPPNCTAAGKDDRPSPPSSFNRIPVFASLGDTINNRTVRVSGAKKNPFLKDVVFILTADQKVERQVRKALHKAGYGDGMINTIVAPQDLVQLGVDSESDSLLFLIRMATKITPMNPNPAVESYMASPGRLLRLTPKKSSRLDPFPPPELRVRGVGNTEVKLLPLVDQLGKAILNTFNNYKAEPISTVNWYEGYNCIENSENCMGDNRDTPYVLPGFNPLAHIPYQDLTLNDEKEFFVVYGVNHKATEKAIYSNISVYGWQRKCSPVVIGDEDMVGSANAYLGSDDPAADMLYAYVIARPGGCNEIGMSDFCREVSFDCKGGVSSGEPIAIGFRAYVEPKTNVGAAYSEIVLDRIVKFTP